MQYTGKIIKMLAPETISTGGGDKQKRTIVLEEVNDREYKGSIAVDVRGEKVALFDTYTEGTVVTVSLNSKSREYQGRYYNSITAWRVETDQGGSAPAPTPVPAAPVAAASADAANDDLPF